MKSHQGASRFGSRGEGRFCGGLSGWGVGTTGWAGEVALGEWEGSGGLDGRIVVRGSGERLVTIGEWDGAHLRSEGQFTGVAVGCDAGAAVGWAWVG